MKDKASGWETGVNEMRGFSRYLRLQVLSHCWLWGASGILSPSRGSVPASNARSELRRNLFRMKPSMFSIIENSLMSESPERQLWRHVLYAVFSDLESSSEHVRQNRIFARRWVGKYPSRDFRMVCDLAGFDPDLVHAQFRKIADRKRSFHQGHQFPNQPALQDGQASVSGMTNERRFA
ncbi:hypothetical protein [Loktanella atrilutea]|uniref:hypothetical protein n=1 Tax=Loktanella atrilutea TaxID=366533 RepID=UPI001160C528|nr:hypothetical protein [Loktanella atrilutea]